MSEIKRGDLSGECCFKCAYNLMSGAKAGRRFTKDAHGFVNDPDYGKLMCDRNPDGKVVYGDCIQVCELFELDKTRWHDLKVQAWEWSKISRGQRHRQPTLEDFL